MKKRDASPIHYKNAEEMNKRPSELIAELRNDITQIRGKLRDIKRIFDRTNTDHVEGLLTCGLVVLYGIIKEWKKIETDY